jgi:hypothetical protein
MAQYPRKLSFSPSLPAVLSVCGIWNLRVPPLPCRDILCCVVTAKLVTQLHHLSHTALYYFIIHNRLESNTTAAWPVSVYLPSTSTVTWYLFAAHLHQIWPWCIICLTCNLWLVWNVIDVKLALIYCHNFTELLSASLAHMVVYTDESFVHGWSGSAFICEDQVFFLLPW